MRIVNTASLVQLLAVFITLLVSNHWLNGQDAPVTGEYNPAEFEMARSLTKQADELSSKEDHDSLRKAEEKYLGALNICHKLGDGACVRYAQFRIGRIAMDLLEFEKAGQFFEQALDLKNGSLDRLNEATIRSNLGKIYVALGIDDKAEEHFQNTVTILKATETWEFLGFAFANLAELRRKQSRIEQSLQYYSQALDAFRKAKYLDGEVITLIDIGDLYLATSRHANAKAAYEEASGLAKASKRSELWIQNKICLVENSQGNSSSAIECYAAIATKARVADDQSSLWLALQEIGALYRKLGQYAKAIEIFGTMLDDSIRTGDMRAKVFAYWGLGISHNMLGKPKEALQHYDDALAVARVSGDKAVAKNLLFGKGIIHNELRQTSHAEDAFKQALKISKELKDSAGELDSLIELGNLVHFNDQYPESLRYYEEALPIAERLGNKRSLVFLLLRIGEANYGLRQYDQILSKYEKALSVAQEAGDKTGEAEARGSVSAFYIAVGQFAKAKQHLDRVLAIAIETNNTELEGDVLLSLGETANGAKRFREGQLVYERALRLSRTTENYYLEASALIGIGISQMNTSQLEKARSNLESGLKIAKKANETYRVAQASNELGNVLYRLGRYDEARKYSEQALILGWQHNNPEREAYALFALMQISTKQNRTEEGIFYGKQLINMLQHARQKLKYYGKDVHHGFLKDKEEFYRVLADVLISEGRVTEAEQVLDLLKTEELFDFLRRDSTVTDDLLANISLSAEEKKAFEEYRLYAENLTNLGKELGELQIESRQYEIGKFPKKDRLEELEKKIANANLVFTTFLDGLKLKFGERDVRVSTVESGSQALLKELNEPRTVFISTILGKERLNIIVTSADVQKAYTVPIKEEEINRLVAEFRSVLRNPSFDPRSRGKALFDVLFPDGVMKDLTDIEADTIVWSLDGTLRYVPISALWDGKQYLVERFNNVVITLASRDKLNVPSAGRDKWSALGVGVSKEMSITESDGTVRNFEALLAVPEELCSVIQDPDQKSSCEKISVDSQGVIGGRTLLDEAFTFQNFRDSLGRFPVVHVASHFQLTAGNENDSYLLLGGGADRKLSLAAIRQGGARFAGVDLLTLSACNTAMSAERMSNGLEVEGFGALAQRSGAKSVLASLWAVADSSTRDLMIEFYRQMQPGKTVGKAQALRIAQLSLLFGKVEKGKTPAWRSAEIGKDGATTSVRFTRDPKAPFAHPYYWSPFILIGNWQ